eukprot:TRINITY_DN7941_c0_g2_i1.p1 TRINITY_DN7941_c0_g2~~TRINITY_DN7941_c0_g2_i1.p1  ORF type:complete len:472 (-),score=59.87 TRINITY_DN7941_c0_g2_i1:117-1532(-)
MEQSAMAAALEAFDIRSTCKCEGEGQYPVTTSGNGVNDEFFPCGEPPEDPLPPEEEVPVSPSRPEEGLVTYSADITLPLTEPPLRSGEVWHLSQDGKSFEKAFLCIHSNGLSIRDPGERQPHTSLAWSPFSLVQACRLHTVQADQSQPLLRLFKVSIFHHGLTHFFASHGETADTERARWVADVSRALRILTQSLFPSFQLVVAPLPGARWTATRLLAGYMLLYDDLGVSMVYGELHVHSESTAGFAAYENESCMVQVVHLAIDTHTCVSERVGIDCSCFSLGDHHFSTRSCAEKMLWLRAISNVKVKLRHWAATPTDVELRHYRYAVRKQIDSLPKQLDSDSAKAGAFLPRRRGQMSQLPRNLPLMSPGTGLLANADKSKPMENAQAVQAIGPRTPRSENGSAPLKDGGAAKPEEVEDPVPAAPLPFGPREGHAVSPLTGLDEQSSQAPSESPEWPQGDALSSAPPPPPP